MDYTLSLQSEEDYRLIKKLLKAFEGASIRPVEAPASHLEEVIEEVRNGEIVGPFFSVDELMADLMS